MKKRNERNKKKQPRKRTPNIDKSKGQAPSRKKIALKDGKQVKNKKLKNYSSSEDEIEEDRQTHQHKPKMRIIDKKVESSSSSSEDMLSDPIS